MNIEIVEDDPRNKYAWRLRTEDHRSVVTGPGFKAEVTGPNHLWAALKMARAKEMMDALSCIGSVIKDTRIRG